MMYPRPERVDNGVRVSDLGLLMSELTALDKPDERLGIPAIGTGYNPLDMVLSGGLLPHELVLLGGLPGAGKTLTALQWARHFASQDRPVMFVTYELDELTLLSRLMIQELAIVADHVDSTEKIGLRKAITDFMLGLVEAEEVQTQYPIVAAALESLYEHATHLKIVSASTQTTDATAIRETVRATMEPGSVVIVDYLQKVPVFEANNLSEQVHLATESLKGIAVENDLIVVALAAAREGAIGTRRLRMSDLRGSDSLAHECDIAMILNEKITATSDRHTAFDLTTVEAAKQRVLLSVEKNRRGDNDVHLEFKKDFPNFRLLPDGQFVSEALTEGETVV